VSFKLVQLKPGNRIEYCIEASEIERKGQEVDIVTLYATSPAFHPNSSMITGVVCGIRVDVIGDPLMQKLRYLHKLIDELAHGRAMEKTLRLQVRRFLRVVGRLGCRRRGRNFQRRIRGEYTI